MENKPEIVLLMGPSQSSIYLYNYLKQHFTIKAAIVEEAVSKRKLIKGRIKKLGWFTVFGQLLFQIIVPKVLKVISATRRRYLEHHYHLSSLPIDPNVKKLVHSANAETTIQFLQELKPAIVIINGTRILSKKLLTSIPCSFINTHAGITPAYRGVHGGYWALVNRDKEHCGVTIHFVDAGIDTGDIIEQMMILPSREDNFATYPLHQLGVALPSLTQVIHRALRGSIATSKPSGKSQLWYHPTLWEYIYYLIGRGVK